MYVSGVHQLGLWHSSSFQQTLSVLTYMNACIVFLQGPGWLHLSGVHHLIIRLVTQSLHHFSKPSLYWRIWMLALFSYRDLDDCIYQESVQSMESHLEKESAKRALEKLYTEKAGISPPIELDSCSESTLLALHTSGKSIELPLKLFWIEFHYLRMVSEIPPFFGKISD